jgi:hypothetical protein
MFEKFLIMLQTLGILEWLTAAAVLLALIVLFYVGKYVRHLLKENIKNEWFVYFDNLILAKVETVGKEIVDNAIDMFKRGEIDKDGLRRLKLTAGQNVLRLVKEDVVARTPQWVQDLLIPLLDGRLEHHVETVKKLQAERKAVEVNLRPLVLSPQVPQS